MTRRNVLTAVELTLVTAVLAAAVPILAHATNYGTPWGAPALAGAVVLGSMLAPTALALLLIGAWRWGHRDRDQITAAPSAPYARVPRRDDAAFDDYMRHARHAAAWAAGEQASTTGRHAMPGTPMREQTTAASGGAR